MAAVEAAQEHGLAKLTFARVAEKLAVSDRMVVYYFPSKEMLITEVVGVLGGGLMSSLDAVLPAPGLPVDEVIARAWKALATPANDPVMRLFFELVGLAGAGVAPYEKLAAGILEAWQLWLAERVEGSSRSVREARALAVMAQIDGLLLMRLTMGARRAESAARILRERMS